MTHVTPEMWALWKDHPCTVAFMNEIRVLREDGIRELPGHADNTHRQNIAIGKVIALTNVLEAELELEDEA